MCRSSIWVLFFVFLPVSLGEQKVNAQQGEEGESRSEEAHDEETASNAIVAAKLYWNGTPLNGAKTIEITSQKDLAMLSASMRSVREIDRRSAGSWEPQDAWGRLYVSTKQVRYQIVINGYGYWLDCGLPQFSQRFLSIPLTNTLDTILLRSGARIEHHQKVRLTGYSRILMEEKDWKEISEGRYDRVGPEWDLGPGAVQVMPFGPEANPILLKSSLQIVGPREGEESD